MNNFDFNSPAEIYTNTNISSKRYRMGLSYRRFLTAAEAICFSVEELPSPLLAGTVLEVCEKRFDGRQILELYNREEYPLARRASAS